MQVPEALPVISYGMLAFRYQNRILVYAALYKGHISFYPGDAELLYVWAPRLKGYRVTKGTIQLPLEGAWPQDVLDTTVREWVPKIGKV